MLKYQALIQIDAFDSSIRIADLFKRYVHRVKCFARDGGIGIAIAILYRAKHLQECAMDPKASPKPKHGERNIYCPNYNDCLDYAIENSWRSWNCSQCPYRTIQAITECEYHLTDPEPFYVLPVDVIRERARERSE